MVHQLNFFNSPTKNNREEAISLRERNFYLFIFPLFHGRGLIDCVEKTKNFLVGPLESSKFFGGYVIWFCLFLFGCVS